MSKMWLRGLLALSLSLSGAACADASSAALRTEPSPVPVTAPFTVAPAHDYAAPTREVLAAHRRQQIERLRAYAVAGAFPHNYTSAAPLHMFKDASGNLCAVANLIHQDGRDDIVDATVTNKNDLAVADVESGPVMDWVLASGLTKEEVVRIQEPAPMMRAAPRPVAILPVRVVKTMAAATPKPPTEAEMQAKIRAHVAQVMGELEANADASLDLATKRYDAAYAGT